MTDIIFTLITLFLAVTLIYRTIKEEKHKGANGFGAGVFVIAFIFRASHVLAPLVGKYLL